MRKPIFRAVEKIRAAISPRLATTRVVTFERLLFLFGIEVAPYGRQHRRSLLASHDTDTRIGPHPQKSRLVRAPRHSVIACAERPADYEGELWNGCARNGRNHLCTMLCD